MAETAISCSSGCAFEIRSIRDRQLPVKRRTRPCGCPRQVMSLHLLAARLNNFTLRHRSRARHDIGLDDRAAEARTLDRGLGFPEIRGRRAARRRKGAG